jgi:hypothetical protein
LNAKKLIENKRVKMSERRKSVPEENPKEQEVNNNDTDEKLINGRK